MSHGDPKNPAKNPHPVSRYEVTATSDVPGPWDSMIGYIHYDVANKQCIPMDSFLGEQNVPNIGVDIEMNRVDDHTWKGYFYRDALQDDDYFNLGVCHWDVTSVSANTTAQGVRFGWGGLFDELLRDSPETSYFKKSSYGDQSFAPDGAPNYSPLRPEYRRDPSEFFPVTIAIGEAPE